jgi:hypothetical protein
MQTFLDAMPIAKEKMIAALTISDTKTRPFNRRRPSDPVPANTFDQP